jgi:hypothetical protein
MAIYRGAGGAGDATGDSASEALLVRELAAEVQLDANAAEAAKLAALAAQAAAETAETNAETAETNAETAETNAAASASSASSSASTATTQAGIATTQATNASNSATAAASSASSSSTSATNAASSASAAATSATNANNSANAASTSATDSANSATAAAGSASTATTQATNAANSATAAATSATNAANSATSASTSASTATTQAGIATTQATNAANSATAAATSATNASNSASAAATSATNASNSASASSTSATNSANSATAAATSATNAANSATAASGFADDASDSADAAAASAASINPSNITITGGSINGTTVGASTASTGAFTSLSASGSFSANGGATLGDASGDSLTINSSAVSIPNGLNFGSNNLVLSSGAVVIGAPNPVSGYALDVRGAQYLQTNSNPTNGQAIFVSNQTTISNNGSRIGFDAYNIGAASFGIPSDSAALAFYVNGVNTERMRIDSSGNVGIGTSSPAYKLDISGTNPRIRLNETTGFVMTSYVNTGGTFDVGRDSSAGAVVGTAYAGFLDLSGAYPIVFRTNATERMRIDSSGNVGIGTTGGTYKLDVVGTGAQSIRVASSNGDLATLRMLSSGNNEWSIASDTVMRFRKDATEYMRIDSSGNVGIGTSSPSVKLHVIGSGRFNASSTNSVGISTTNSSNGSYYTLYSYGSNGDGVSGWANSTLFESVPASGGNFVLSAYGGTMVFQTGTGRAERMRLNSSGDLIIGGTTAIALLTVSGLKGGTPVAAFSNFTTSGNVSCVATSLESNGNNTSSYHLRATTQNIANWYLYGNGASSFSSDKRLKKNIETTRNGYIDDLMKLRVVKYNWRNDVDGTPKELGLIAQEVEQVFAGLVQDDLNKISENDDTVYKQLKISVLPFMLLKAIQEQQVIINDLKARIETLEAK